MFTIVITLAFPLFERKLLHYIPVVLGDFLTVITRLILGEGVYLHYSCPVARGH